MELHCDECELSLLMYVVLVDVRCIRLFNSNTVSLHVEHRGCYMSTVCWDICAYLIGNQSLD